MTTEFSYTPHRLDDPAFYRSEIDRIFRKGKTPAEKRMDIHPMLAPHCYMCHRPQPALDWIELDAKPRVVCSTRCYHNYCKGSDII